MTGPSRWTSSAWAWRRPPAQNPDTEVQLRADEGVAYGRVVEVIGLAQKAGLSRIGFVADPVKTGFTAR